ncbi:MAG: glycosyltransferase [Candidatus Woesearchaeota archaeon]|nr:glycosyltransferase [Candidatus Woesearchaeota archaeon]
MYTGKCSIIIPAHNEESTIKNCCLRFADHVMVSEVIVVANACSDMTHKEALAGNAMVIQTPNKGKGRAIKVGLKHAKEDVVVLFDGDIKNPSAIFTEKLLAGLTTKEVGLVKGAFDRSEQPGPVTDMLVKPVLEVINHPAKVISQPLSGMVAVRRDFATSIEIPDDFGVELTMLLAAYEKKMQVTEVMLPKIEHMQRPWSHYMAMAIEVAETFKRFGILTYHKET